MDGNNPINDNKYYSLNLGTIEIKHSRQSFYRVSFFFFNSKNTMFNCLF